MKPVISVIYTAGCEDTHPVNLANQRLKEYEIINADISTGLEKAQGEYVLFVDGLETYPGDMLEKLYDAAIHNKADMVVSDCELIDGNGDKTARKGIHSEWIRGGKQIFNWEDCRGRVLDIVRSVTGNTLYRKQFLLDAKLDRSCCCYEVLYSILGAVAADKIVYLKNQTFRRKHTDDDGTAKLLKVPKIVKCVVEYVRNMTNCEELWNAVMYFSILQYVDNYEKWCTGLDSGEKTEFYESAHRFFNSDVFDQLTEKRLNDSKLFRKYSIIRRCDLLEIIKLKKRKIIVSFTTYPARITGITKMLDSIYAQTRKADKVIMWLAEEQFPHGEDDLPDDLRELLEEDKLEVRWCDDLKPHKKYFYALQEFTDDVVVTIDDDLQYPPYILENLYMSYLQYPEAVSAVRTHWMVISDKCQMIPYRYWMKETDACLYEPKMQLFATGGAGTLYPPGIYDSKWFDKEKIKAICLWADDIWLKLIEVMSGIPVVAAMPCEDLQYLPGSQEVALYHKNVDADHNDVQLQKINDWLKPEYGDNILARKILEYDGESVDNGLIRVCECHEKERRKHRNDIGRISRQLKQTNDKLQQTYDEKADRGIRIKELEKKSAELQARNRELQAKLGELQAEKDGLQEKTEQLKSENAVLQKQRSIWYKIKNDKY